MQKLDLFHTQDLQNILESNAPWIFGKKSMPPIESFHREVFFRIKKQLKASHQLGILIKGPRRVGKTQILYQLIQNLLAQGTDPKRILFLSLDDILIQSLPQGDRLHLVHALLNAWARHLGFDSYDEIQGEAYCFLDEVQALSSWAGLVKNRIDRNPSIRVVLSGSAAHSIFQKSLETLLGRVISEEVFPFSFREFLQFQGVLGTQEISELQKVQSQFEADLKIAPLFSFLETWKDKGSPLKKGLGEYLLQGGFPQLWKFQEESILEKYRLIDENYVKKVTLEDLMLLREIRKPEIFEQLLRHFFARPGQEYNQNKVAGSLGTTAITLSEALELLRQTDLLIFVEKFSQKAEPLRRQNLKIYPIDLSLTAATSRRIASLESPEKGFIAETLVAQNLARLKGISRIGFLGKTVAKNASEIDFYLRSDLRETAIEVKFQPKISKEDLDFLQTIVREKELSDGLCITQDLWEVRDSIFLMPLWAFALLG